MTERYANAAASTLVNDILAADDSGDIVDASEFPVQGNFRIRIDDEILIVDDVVGSTFSLLRGQEGTTAEDHTQGSAITHVLTAGGYTTGIDERIATHVAADDPHGDVQGFTFVFNQASPIATWVIVHNLGGFPSVTVVDSADTQMEGDVVYNSEDQITVSFTSGFAGKAYLS